MKPNIRHLLLPLCVLCVLCGESPAALDPELSKPYKLQVVLHVSEHRQLTKTFQDLLESELRDSLQAALGDLAKVEVVRQHPKLAEILDKGLSSLDTWKDVSDTKTHFVLIDFIDGQYDVQARQHDGLTGQASPIVRRDRTPDRLFVARTAALLIGRDFGLVGTVTQEVNEDTVKVSLKGANLGVPLDRWVRQGEVFALVQISQAGGLKASRVPWALLQVQEPPVDGVCTCKLFHRHPNPLEAGAGVAGYRCLKLATIRTAVRIRLVKANATTIVPPDTFCTIQARKLSFDEKTSLEGTTLRDGIYNTVQKDQGLFDNVAFITILSPPTQVRARIPVALVDERPVVIPVSIEEADRSQIVVRRDQWLQRVYESLLVLADQFKTLETLVGKKKREEAIERARGMIDLLREDVTRLEKSRVELVKEAKDVKGFKLEIADGDQRLMELKAGEAKLRDFISRLGKILKEENDPKRLELKAKASQAQLMEEEAEYGKALDLYREVIDGGAADDELKKLYEQLKTDWMEKGDKHIQARKFIYETWATIDPLKIKDQLGAAKEAFEECKKAGDKLSPRRLVKITVAHVSKLKQIADGLDSDANEEDRETAKVIVDINKGLTELITDVAAFVGTTKP